jgi:hypothetical protein
LFRLPKLREAPSIHDVAGSLFEALVTPHERGAKDGTRLG